MTDEGTEAMVQISDENRCILLLVSSNQECPTKSLELRSSVINTIRSKQKEFCSSVEVYEYLISPSQLSHVPDCKFSELTVFAMKDVARNVQNESRFMLDSNRKERISLEHLLHFDPYQVLSPTAVQHLFASDKLNEPVPASFFAGKNPLVSGFFDRCANVVQSMDDELTNTEIIVIIVHVLSFPSFLSLVCVQEIIEMTAADLPLSPPSSPPTSATPTSFVLSTGMVKQ